MPWVKRKQVQDRIYWISGGVALVLIGVLAGYALWGQTHALMTNLERHLSATDSKMQSMEKRLQSLEAKAGGGNATAPAESAPRAY